MATPHIEAKIGEIAETVLMPGDSLRAKFMAEKYLKNVKLVSSVRNALFFTGEYKNKKVTIAGSGMGMFSIGTYAQELYSEYGVNNIIRCGSAGAYSDKLNVMDVIIVNRAYSDNDSISKLTLNENQNEYFPSKELMNKLINSAKKLNKKYYVCSTNSTDVFYSIRSLEDTIKVTKSDVVEAESFALFACAKRNNKRAATILQISDSLPKGDYTDSKTREQKFTDMFEIALETLI
ncbi:purine-nucleoside phosphorylase [Metamycoplasma buccale]|uniref:purine-nucleoside phosphorylase n=1 Tax=Metamycoplasma buccale TaxID=55602 RepID=UPI00398F5119